MLNVLYTLGGGEPYRFGGGPGRCIGVLLDGLLARDKKLDLAMLTNKGLISSNSLPDYWREKRPQPVGPRSFKESLGKIDAGNARLLVAAVVFRSLQKVLGRGPYVSSLLDLADAQSRKYFRQWLGETGGGLVHSHTPLGAVAMIREREVFGRDRLRVISTYHTKGSLVRDLGLEESGLTQDAAVMRKREEFVLRGSDVLTFPSAGAKKLMAEDYPGVLESADVRVIYSGIEFEDIASKADEAGRSAGRRPDGSFVMLNVAAHVSQKRVDLLLEALAALRSEAEYRLVQVGEGALTEELQAKAEQLGVSESVQWLGRQGRDNVLELMAICDAFVMPSEQVVFDLVTLEAMAAGIPAIVSADGGNLECIEDGAHGFLTKVGDVGSVVEAVRACRANPKRTREVRERARERVREEFSIERQVTNYQRLYEEVCES